MYDIDSLREIIIADSSKIWGIASCNKGEGKTYIATLLQESLQKSGKKVLLISADGDWDKHKNNYVQKKCLEIRNADQLVMWKSDVRNPDVLGIKEMDNFEAVVYKEGFKEFLKNCEREYDVVLIDMMALNEQSISKKVCSLCDNTFLVIAGDTCSGYVVRKLVKQLRIMGVKIKGAVLNEHNLKKSILKM